MNKYRLSNNKYLNLVNNSEGVPRNFRTPVFALPAPYEIKDGVRYYAGTTKWVSEKNKIIEANR